LIQCGQQRQASSREEKKEIIRRTSKARGRKRSSNNSKQPIMAVEEAAEVVDTEAVEDIQRPRRTHPSPRLRSNQGVHEEYVFETS
jgi:hypothetical protein